MGFEKEDFTICSFPIPIADIFCGTINPFISKPFIALFIYSLWGSGVLESHRGQKLRFLRSQQPLWRGSEWGCFSKRNSNTDDTLLWRSCCLLCWVAEPTPSICGTFWFGLILFVLAAICPTISSSWCCLFSWRALKGMRHQHLYCTWLYLSILARVARIRKVHVIKIWVWVLLKEY